MEFYDVIRNRKTIREWQDRDVSPEAIRRILDAGLSAPSNNHLREWEFIVLHTAAEKETGLQHVKKWVDEHALAEPERTFPAGSAMQEMYQYALPRQYSMLSTASYVITPLFKAQKLSCDYVNQLNVFSSIWCVTENIFLAATAEELGYSMRIPVGEEGPAVCRTRGSLSPG